MNRFLPILLLIAAKAFCQINPADSTVQVVAYWDKNESHTYTVVHEKNIVNDVDTTNIYHVEYKVDITVKDSTATSYTIEWKYRDYKARKNNLDAQTDGILNGMRVLFKTNEIGEYQELLNLDEIKSHNNKAVDALEKKHKLPEYYLKILKSRSASQNVESTLLKDVVQFHVFHGYAMALGEELKDTLEEKNNYGTTIKSDRSVFLEEINLEEEVYLIKFFQTFDEASSSQAVGDAIEEFISPEMKDKFKLSINEDFYGTYFHNSGWPLSSYFQRDMIVNGEKTLETRAIDFEE